MRRQDTGINQCVTVLHSQFQLCFYRFLSTFTYREIKSIKKIHDNFFFNPKKVYRRLLNWLWCVTFGALCRYSRLLPNTALPRCFYFLAYKFNNDSERVFEQKFYELIP